MVREGVGVSSKVTEKLLVMATGAIQGNHLSRSMADASKGKTKSTLFNNLVAEFVEFGRIYVKTDH